MIAAPKIRGPIPQIPSLSPREDFLANTHTESNTPKRKPHSHNVKNE